MTIDYEDIIERTPSFYKDTYKRLVIMSIFMQVIIIFLTFLVIVQSNMKIQNKFFLTYITGGVKKINPS